MATDTQAGYTTGTVTAQDGTTIGYRQLGHGPGLVILHGAMSSAHNHMQLAEALADAFTVYIVDRRGRGLSGAYSKHYSIENEVDDLGAVLKQTDAEYVFGVSSGAIISLKAALALRTIRKIAIFEPPLFTHHAVPTDILMRFDREIAQGKIAAALVTGMKGAQMGPPIFNAIPNWLLAPLINMSMKNEDKQDHHDYVPMREIAPLLHYDFQVVAEMSGKIASFKALSTETLLLGGSKSPAYLKAALDELEKVLPHSKRIEFPGLDHGASWNSDRDGQPEPVAQALRQFFT